MLFAGVIRMNDIYIMPEEAHRKLTFARGLSQPVYVCAPMGFGKTELVHQYLKSRNYLEFSAKTGWQPEELEAALEQALKKNQTKKVVVIDDLQYVGDDEVKKQVLSLAARNNVYLILIGRGSDVKWLSPLVVEKGLIRITEQDLALGPKEIEVLFSKQGIDLSAQDIEKAYIMTNGAPKSLQFLGHLLLHQEKMVLTDELMEKSGQVYRDYIYSEISTFWPSELIEFLMQVSIVDHFTVEMASFITGNGMVAKILSAAESVGSFIGEDKGVYTLRRPILLLMRQKRDESYDISYVKNLYYNAGLYYETRGKIIQALEMYEKSGSNRQIKELLIRNARCNPANGYYYELKPYYETYPEEEIRKNPTLLAGMSMLYSLTLEPDKSEYWYQQLKQFARSAKGADLHEAVVRLAYLDISLPHRGSKGMVEILKSMPALIFNKGMKLPELSVTSNMPSVMNGGKDFCDWSLHDVELASTIGRVVELCLGPYAKGLIEEALGESFYEKGKGLFDVLPHLSKAQMQAQAGGKKEMEFACLGIYCRMQVLYGKDNEALEQLNNFKKSLPEDTAPLLTGNLEAFITRIALHDGDLATAEKWLVEAPDETAAFNIMARYLYLTKVRVYIAFENYNEALALLEKLISYAVQYDRPYVRMESLLLKAVICYRAGEDYLSPLQESLTMAEKYSFVRIISEEGTAVLPLLKEFKKKAGAEKPDFQTWLAKVIKETDRVASLYPSYLRSNIAYKRDFSDKALAVLSLLAKGYSVTQIGNSLNMKPDTVKYYTKQIYKKLGVSGRSDAVLTARNMGIL